VYLLDDVIHLLYNKDIETLANTYECVSRDAGTGEILGG